MGPIHFIPDLPQERSNIIKVIGVGGGGSNAVNYMFKEGIVGVDFYVCNTDAQALEMSPVPNKIHLGSSISEGLGAGSDPDVGRKCAQESVDRITDVMRSNTRMVFVTAGMGGGTGTGAAPVIAKVAKEMGILTVGIVTTPFEDEGPERRNQAQQGIDNLKPHVDALIIIGNDRIIDMYGDLRISEAFAMADKVLCTAAKGIAEIITIAGQVNVDFKDVKTAMTDSGRAILGTGVATGQNRAMEASQMAIDSPLLDDTSIKGAKHILINITYGTEEPYMREQRIITQFFQQEAGHNAKLKFGLCHNPKMGNELAVTLIATGFDNEGNVYSEDDHTSLVLEIDTPEIAEPAAPVVTEKGQFEIPLSDEDRFADYQRQRRQEEREFLMNPDRLRDKDLNVPAYLRQHVKLEPTPNSHDTQISKTYLTATDEEGEQNTRLGKNPYLHGNVD